MRLTAATAGLLTVVAGGGAAFAASATPTPSPAGGTTTSAPVSPAAPRTPEPGEAAAKVNREAAIKIAQDKVPGAQPAEAEFDGDETPATWEIELRKDAVEHDFEIDATTGAILEQESETDTDQDDDGDDADGQDDD
ncbi:Peptidase propeptide and YPEB domain-containing protein [Streptosporangium subroseum]|uniref:Peptidase propeptide and YPEB domain-containing protein n=2 Tax=Streptosporangium subroseum TaxID=106412 RepID=A0A239J145_9ACTN|nr:Peptidase propeptide and YPEB domain-containing protein [Streptosporangium subroseum]